MNRRRNRILARARVYAALERPMTADVAKLLNEVARNAADAGSVNGAIEAAMAVRDRLELVFVARMSASVRAFAAQTLEEIGAVKKAEPIANPADRVASEAMNWIRARAAENVTDVTGGTIKRIRQIIAETEREGLGNIAAAKRIQETLGGRGSFARARAIAVTETHTAANHGSQMAAEATGIDFEREWCAAMGGLNPPRPTHAEADGQRRDMETSFLVGGYALSYPGDMLGPPQEVINCRCTVLYHPKR